MKKIAFVLTICVIISAMVVGCSATDSSSSPSTNPTTTPSATVTPTPSGSIPSEYRLVGFAATGDGTTGGSGASSVTVTTGTELQNAINAVKNGSSNRIIYVNGIITVSNNNNSKVIELKGSSATSLLSNISIIGVGTKGELNGVGIKMRYVKNIIIQNLKIHHVKASDDAIGIEGSANHIWVDHCELYNNIGDVDGDGDVDDTDKDYYDGLFDVKSDAADITFSWNYVHDSYKTSLIGSSDTDNNDRRITFHHNYFKNCNSRLPSYRFGTGHVFNNYYESVAGSGVNSRMEAKLRVESNYFSNVKDPICSLDSSVKGYWDVKNNKFENCTGSQETTSTCSFVPPYSYNLDAVESVKAKVTQYAGVGIVNK